MRLIHAHHKEGPRAKPVTRLVCSQPLCVPDTTCGHDHEAVCPDLWRPRPEGDVAPPTSVVDWEGYSLPGKGPEAVRETYRWPEGQPYDWGFAGGAFPFGVGASREGSGGLAGGSKVHFLMV
jgi:hypothetical protein